MIYIIQKHAASNLHYDLRLEYNGVLKSWVLPKEPSSECGIKRLAIQVEDHQLGYEKFEGEIPKGQYGAGQVEIWDAGEYEFIEGSITTYKILINIYGSKLKGEYSLRKFNNDETNKKWLFQKRKK